MKKLVLFLVLALPFIISRGQNLVPNPGFELYSGCPTYYTQIDCVLFWTNTALWPGPGGSPDYFNSCATPSSLVNVPDNIFGYQQAHSGDAYCGITLWDMNNLFREYIQVPFASTLTPGCYQFEMYVNLANKYKYTASPVGVYFSSTPITGVPNFLPLPYTPQINITGFTTDTLNWTHLTGNYTALGNENYLIIGNFYDNAGTVSSFVNSAGVYDQSYIFIDDVSLTMCASSSINEYDGNNMFTIYPNPVTDYQLQIISANPQNDGGTFEMFDINGRKVYSVEVLQWDSGVIELPELNQGIYHGVITNGNYRKVNRVAVINNQQ
jgi:hypothetical protein